MLGKDIESVLKWFGEITVGVENVILSHSGHDDWTLAMKGVKVFERTCKMKIEHNIPSLILVRGQKIRIDYAGQPKTCSHCLKYWSACPGGGKVDKCKKEGGVEKDLKSVFKNHVNRMKRKGGASEQEQTVPEYIPNPDMIRFTRFPEAYKAVDFKKWLDNKDVSFLDQMVFKETKPGVFSISTVEIDEGEVIKLEAEEAADIVMKLNGTQFENTNKRIMVSMIALTTPEKRKPDVINIDVRSDEELEQLAILPPPGDKASGSSPEVVEETAPKDLVEVDTKEGESNEDDEGGDEKGKRMSLMKGETERA